jgi:DNA-binding CsgD family transcriptional regulator
MSAAEAEKLVLIPTGPASSGESWSVEPTTERQVPLSGTRVSHRGLADQIAHHPVGGGARLNRESLLGGDWRIVDVERRNSQLRVFLRPGGALMSSRENEVLRSVLSGIPDRELSLRMGITRQCVCGHLGNSVSKLGSSSRFTALQAWRVLGEAEKGRLGRATIAEVAFGDDKIFLLVRRSK